MCTSQPNTRDYISRREIAEMLGVSRWTVAQLAHEDGFPKPIRLGTRTLRYRRQAIDAWCRARENQAPPARANYAPTPRINPSRFEVVEVA